VKMRELIRELARFSNMDAEVNIGMFYGLGASKAITYPIREILFCPGDTEFRICAADPDRSPKPVFGDDAIDEAARILRETADELHNRARRLKQTAGK